MDAQSRETSSVLVSTKDPIDTVPTAVISIDSSGVVSDYNSAAKALLDGGSGGLLRSGAPFMAFVASAARRYVAWRAAGTTEPLDVTLRVRSGIVQAVLWQSPENDRGETTLSIIADRRGALAGIHRLAFDEAATGMIVANQAGKITAVNSALSTMLGLDNGPLIGRNWASVLLGNLSPALQQAVTLGIREGGDWRGQVAMPMPSGGDRLLDMRLRVQPLDPDGGAVDRVEGAVYGTFFGQVSDVTDGSIDKQALREQARRDQLTGLLNRSGFLEVVAERFDQAQRSGSALTMLYLDLDNFKSLNDHFGHRYGDALLEAFAKRLKSSLKSRDVIGRVGGDEFTVLFDPGLPPAILERVIAKLRDRLLQEYQLDELTYTCTSSFGSAEYPWDASNDDELLEFADHAMYQAKTSGRNQHARFDRKVFREWAAREELMKSIEAGIDHLEFVPYYQPVYDTTTGDVCGAEALVRWIDSSQPDLVRQPGEFLPLVDGNPAGIHMAVRMIDQVFVHMRSFAESVAPISVSINLSAAQLRAEDVVSHIEALALQYPDEITRLRVELIESAFYDGDPIIAANLARLIDVGATLSLDDFGTGHSSMLSLRAHDFSQLKIDRQFLVAASAGRREDVLVFESMVDLSRKLGLETVAEGVETREQLAYLGELGCDRVQGFLLARPMPKDEFRSLLEANRVAS